MRFRKLAAVFVACMALTAVAANAAQAAVHWTVGGSELTGSEEVKISGGPWTLSTTLLGTPIELTAEGLECASSVSKCTIEGAGASKGALKYTGVKVTKPSSCSVSASTITTEKLKDQLSMSGTKVLDTFSPVVSGGAFAVIDLVGEECPLNEIEAEVTGAASGESPNATGKFVTDQTLTFSAASQEAAGTELLLGNAVATLSGTAHNKVASEAAFGAGE